MHNYGNGGSITIEANPDGLLGMERNLIQSKLGKVSVGFELKALSAAGRQWKLTAVEVAGDVV